MNRFATWFLFSAIAGSAACGGSSTASLASGQDATAEGVAACLAVTNARCEFRDRCTDGVYNAEHYGDAAVCESQDLTSCETALTAPGTSQTAASYTACAAALTSESCSGYFTATTEPQCVPAPGAFDAGASCTYPGQCASTYCQIPIGAACGTCQPLPVVGSSCVLTGECGRDLDCTTSGICEAFVASGGPCDSSAPCAGDYACVTPTGASQGTCQQQGAQAGAACDPDDVKAPSCSRALGFYCSAGACKTLIESTAGGNCGTIPDAGDAICIGGSLCIVPSGSKEGSCVAPAAVGAACDNTNGPPCLDPARCVLTADGGTAGTCQNLDPSQCN